MALERERKAAAEPAAGGERPARLALAAVTLALVGLGLGVDLPRVSKGEFWGDGATYYAMAWSLASDLDLRYEAKDLARALAEYPRGPQGLFLKEAAGALSVDGHAGFPWLRRVRGDEGRLYYAKALLYPLLAAPLVAVFGTRGLLLCNSLLFSIALWLAFAILRRRGLAPGAALGLVTALLLLTVTPVYLVWPTPEILGLALVTAGFWSWAAGRPLLAALLLGVAAYLKYPNALLAAPLLLDPLLPRRHEAWAGPGWGRRLGESSRRCLVMLTASASLFALNAALTGELNYQGGLRKTFYGRFPFDASGARFDNTGTWMTTNQVGPLVSGPDDAKVTAQSGPARRAGELRESFFRNLGYFWIGRFGGALAYFLPAVVAALLFLAVGPRERAGWLALVAVAASWIAYIWIIPDNWYGGGGAVGNRYFLSLLPAFFFVVSRRSSRWVAASGVAGAFVFLTSVLLSPVRHSIRPGEHATGPAYEALPAELTMLNDLSAFTETWRKKRPFGFVGNAERPADADAFFLYFLDDGTYGKEEWAGRPGFWLRGGARAEIVVRAFDLLPVARVRLRLWGGPLGDMVDARLGALSERVRLSPGERREIELVAGRGVAYYDTYLHVLRLRSRRGGPLADGRRVGAFVEPSLVMGPPFGAGALR